MQDAKDFKNIASDSVGDNVGKTRGDEFTGSRDATCSSKVRMVGKMANEFDQTKCHASRRRWIVGFDV